MRILQLCKKFPFPLKDGESIAVTGLSRALHHAGAEITLLAMNTSKHYVEITRTPAELEHYKEIHSISVDNRLKVWDAFLNLFSDESYHVSRFVSPAFEKKLIHLLSEEDYDVVQLETLFLSPYIPVIRAHSRAVISMRAHNVEHEIWERIADNTRFPLKKIYLAYLAKKLKHFEVSHLNQYDFLAAITCKDMERFRSMGFRNAGMVTPIGIAPADYKPDFTSFRRNLSIAFIGSLDWQPNIEGINWFLDEVWSKLHRRFGQIHLHIAGRNAPQWLKKKRIKNMNFVGEVPDASAFINNHSIVVVPLRSGSGMRAKILEAMALGKVVITTSIGLEGIPAKHKKEVLIADNVTQFIEAFAFCQQQNGRLEQMGRKAMDFVNRQFETKEIGKQLMEAYSNLVVDAIKV